MKKIILIILMVATQNTIAGPYIMTKHEFKLKDSNYSKTVNQIRMGYEAKINNWSLYMEAGGGEQTPNAKSFGSGTSLLAYELGATKKINDKFSVKIKWEGKDYTGSYLDHKIEIKTKYKF